MTGDATSDAHLPDNRAEHPELEAEQAYLDHARRCLHAMAERADEMVAVGERAVRDENTVDARVVGAHLERRVRSLQQKSGALCFGRIDTDDEQRWYVGRRHIEDTDSRPVVVDWRAPVAAPFYRATAVDPCGLTFRRRFSVAGDRIEAIFDEDLSDPDTATAAGVPDPLLAELDRSRSGQMRDIVATIAGEQDVIIRAPLARLLVVQGGPGTGKTAVGLHRAAFLLYQHRMQFIDTPVLVIGPNPLFLRYIAEVLPSLGETSVRQATLPGLLSARYRTRAVDSPAVAEIKGRAVMATVIERAVRDRLKAPVDGLEVRSGVAVVRFDSTDLQTMMKNILERPLPVNSGRDVFRRMVVAEAWRRHSARPGVDPGGEPTFTAGIRNSADFTKALNRMWPRLNPVTVVGPLLRTGARLRRAADGLLTGEEQRLIVDHQLDLHRSAGPREGRSTSADGQPWTEADLALLDECAARCDGVDVTYGHIIVDEAQDLSPMALRMIGRRSRSGSMTVLGDLAQATRPGATGSWPATVEALTGAARLGDSGRESMPGIDVQYTELTVGYRVPAAILDVANRLLVEAAPSVTPARSVRPGGERPRVIATTADRLDTAVIEEVVSLDRRSMSIAVIAPDALVSRLVDTISAAGVVCDRVGGAGLPGQEAVAVLDPTAAKGLEFDAVVVVEPGTIAGSASGLRHLYVATTRPVQYLCLVTSRSLPPLLDLEPEPSSEGSRRFRG